MATVSEILARALQLHHAGQFRAAEDLYRQVLAVEPRHAETLSLLGAVMLQSGRCAESIPQFEQAMLIEPHVASHYCNLGSALITAGQQARAAAVLAKAAQLDPTSADVHYNLGLSQFNQRQFEGAIECYRRALALRPGFASAMANLGVALQELGELAQARPWLEQAQRLEPQNSTHWFNLATLCKDEGRPAAAIECYDRAIELQPRYAQAICGRAVALLSMGAYAAGWPGYETRSLCPQFDTLSLPQPRWNGQPWQGTLLVHSEQGLGDTLQFIRYVDLIRPLGGQLIVGVQKALVPLLRQSGYTEVVARDELPPCDMQVPLMSLPSVLKTELATIPRQCGYLAADDQDIARWQARLAEIPGHKIGIAWQGRASFRADRFRSIPLTHFAPLAGVPDAKLVSLQKGAGTQQMDQLAGMFEIVSLGESVDEAGAFLDTAAIMRNLDLVITSDTAIAHLAGGLGVRVWVALSAAPDWRWLLRTSECPWYPTMRLFRQRRLGDWADVFQAMADQFRRELPESKRGGP